MKLETAKLENTKSLELRLSGLTTERGVLGDLLVKRDSLCFLAVEDLVLRQQLFDTLIAESQLSFPFAVDALQGVSSNNRLELGDTRLALEKASGLMPCISFSRILDSVDSKLELATFFGLEAALRSLAKLHGVLVCDSCSQTLRSPGVTLEQIEVLRKKESSIEPDSKLWLVLVSLPTGSPVSSFEEHFRKFLVGGSRFFSLESLEPDSEESLEGVFRAISDEASSAELSSAVLEAMEYFGAEVRLVLVDKLQIRQAESSSDQVPKNHSKTAELVGESYFHSWYCQSCARSFTKFQVGAQEVKLGEYSLRELIEMSASQLSEALSSIVSSGESSSARVLYSKLELLRDFPHPLSSSLEQLPRSSQLLAALSRFVALGVNRVLFLIEDFPEDYSEAEAVLLGSLVSELSNRGNTVLIGGRVSLYRNILAKAEGLKLVQIKAPSDSESSCASSKASAKSQIEQPQLDQPQSKVIQTISAEDWFTNIEQGEKIGLVSFDLHAASWSPERVGWFYKKLIELEEHFYLLGKQPLGDGTLVASTLGLDNLVSDLYSQTASARRLGLGKQAFLSCLSAATSATATSTTLTDSPVFDVVWNGIGFRDLLLEDFEHLRQLGQRSDTYLAELLDQLISLGLARVSLGSSYSHWGVVIRARLDLFGSLVGSEVGSKEPFRVPVGLELGSNSDTYQTSLKLFFDQMKIFSRNGLLAERFFGLKKPKYRLV